MTFNVHRVFVFLTTTLDFSLLSLVKNSGLILCVFICSFFLLSYSICLCGWNLFFLSDHFQGHSEMYQSDWFDFDQVLSQTC